jgi:hypothetical protein
MLGFHRELCAYGFQMDASYESQPAIEFGVGSKRHALDQLYGFKTMQSGALGVVVS